MSHPFEEGPYIIHHKLGPELENAAALENDDLLSLISNDAPGVPFSRLVWRLTYSGSGYKIQNVYTNEFLYAPYLNKNALVMRDKENFTTWNIQPDGKDTWRFVVPDQDLYWTWTKLIGGKDPANVKLDGSDGIPDQYFTLQLFVGP